jgi:hypothetical protein
VAVARASVSRISGFSNMIGGIDRDCTISSAVIVIGLDGNKRACVLDEFYERQASQEAVAIPSNALAREGSQCKVRVAVKGTDSVRARMQDVTSLLSSACSRLGGWHVRVIARTVAPVALE